MIDDEPSIVRGLAQLLRRDGYQVETADNGRHALAHLQAQPYHVILSDLQMPDLDGLELCGEGLGDGVIGPIDAGTGVGFFWAGFGVRSVTGGTLAWYGASGTFAGFGFGAGVFFVTGTKIAFQL